MAAQDHLGKQFTYEDDEDENSHIIRHPNGSYIDYSHYPETHIPSRNEPSTNSIYWAQSHEKGTGTELVHEMLRRHPADQINLGDVSESGNHLGKKIARLFPEKTVTRADPKTGGNKRYRPK